MILVLVMALVQLSSTGPYHCEFDFEFLGNVSGQPYILHTNIFVNGTGGREQQINLWFDATAEYHYYNFQWNKDLLVFYIDNTPIRMFRNLEGIVPNFDYPTDCPMALYLSVWDGSKWATEGGRIKIDWSAVPFVASYSDFRMDGCPATQGNQASIDACQNSTYAAPGPKSQTIGATRTRKLRQVRQNCMHYNYCDDIKRYPTLPPECAYNVL
jgi:xyloglucan:xyloglucosyl transferase